MRDGRANRRLWSSSTMAAIDGATGRARWQGHTSSRVLDPG